jgi:hypothetical protein
MTPDQLNAHRERRFLSFLVGVGITAAIVIVLGGRWLGTLDCDAGCKPAELAKAISDARTVLAQLLLAAGTGGTLYFTWRNYVRSVDEANDARARSNETQALVRESRTSDNFIKAVEQLGNRESAKPLSDVAMGKTLRRMGVHDATVHGFRSSFRDWWRRDELPARDRRGGACPCDRRQVGTGLRGDALEKRRALMAEWGAFISALPAKEPK